ncbi:NADPH-dependent diflavin oxidoreductase 1 isoform X1 [Tribolium madens]|uniref:NADPH-dependent diflavin oxidoreductase 1 isoform X1 n=2 Tax=Tribolium madens TaxID=41895 RepID=UPI001CF731B3|nr:NADPH-dependent diflavin oxidoreductase 1 isoform X1 [Tribolium madens]
MFINEKIVILYGSQSGNAQDLAERIWRESKRFHFKSTVKSMDDYNVLELVSEQCVIFVCSTTGQGEEPDNMKQFWRFLLRRSLPTDSLVNLKYAVFGLGDSSYTKFNFAAKRLHKRLLQLGGQSLVSLGLGDDQHDLGYDAAADPWIESLWAKLLLIYPLPTGVQPLPKNLPIVPRWSVQSSSLSQNLANKPQSIYHPIRQPDDFTVTVIENERTTHPDHFQDVRLIKLQTDGQEYSPGDVVLLRPKNLPWQVETFQNLLKSHNLHFDLTLKVTQNDPDIPVPGVLNQQLTFQQLCEEYFDLMSIPRRHIFNILAQITDSELEKEKCQEFTTAEGQDDLYTYCNRPKRNIVEVLQDFPHATKNLTKELLFEILPPIKPREFSIASSSKMHRNQIHILLAVVKYKTKLVKERFGLCSNYLAELQPGDQVGARLKKGSFRFPASDVPVIMVGPGTGVAPFRNFIYDQVSEGVASKRNLLLFFGCRNSNYDFHCKEDFLSLQRMGLLNLVPAYSREQEHKVYVQHKILENSDLVWDFLQRNGQIFIAGNAKLMPQEVRQAFVSVCEERMSKEQAERFIEMMEKQGRYQTECWS